ncbi:hypothetical protein [Mesorhizobium sp. B2-3-15]|uniref:hypothetical protein n=1 Tax=Mesorhizobium sp. B2-3-15 TaxID=2589949 RepID=UPI0011272B88|nr:hypothetical protein [Mesorhizobium sp. B2-3-15]TPL66144.1 hypothetical protein FJ954_26290 [Mesorhizobium sp. B2-3-15]
MKNNERFHRNERLWLTLLAATRLVRFQVFIEKARKTACFSSVRTLAILYISYCSCIEIGDLCLRVAALTGYAAACVFVALGLRQAMLFERGGGFVNDGIGGGAGRAGIAA